MKWSKDSSLAEAKPHSCKKAASAMLHTSGSEVRAGDKGAFLRFIRRYIQDRSGLRILVLLWLAVFAALGLAGCVDAQGASAGQNATAQRSGPKHPAASADAARDGAIPA